MRSRKPCALVALARFGVAARGRKAPLRPYPNKARPPFMDAVPALRAETWRGRVSARSEGERGIHEFIRSMVEVLALSR